MWCRPSGVRLVPVDPLDLGAEVRHRGEPGRRSRPGGLAAAVRPTTKVLFLESPANPLLEICDIAGVCKIAREVGARVVVDNVFATPILQAPLKLGADIVVYSATKHIDGQGRVMGGAVLGDKALLDEAYRDFIRHTGPALSPFNAWVLLKGLETLELRVRAQSAAAALLADRIAAHAKVRDCRYPGRPDHPSTPWPCAR